MSSSVSTLTDVDVRLLQNFIGGEWVSAGVDEYVDSYDPATRELLARVPLSDAGDVAAAVSAATDAQRTWRRVPPQRRARAVLALRAAVMEAHDELAAIITQEMGKTRDDARAEVMRGIESIEAAASGPHLLKGEILEEVAGGVDVEMIRQPVGVVGIVTPFNFPVMIPLWFLPFALAAGNAVVLKPSEQVSLASVRLCEIVEAIDAFPAGLVNMVLGAHAAVNGILDDPGIDAVSFVGSARTARYIAERATANGKRVQALGGAKNAMLAMPDADPALLSAGVTGSAFGAAGQRCLAGSVLVAIGTPEEQDSTLETLVASTLSLRVGSGAEPETDVCPLVTRESRERVAMEIDAAVAEGAKVVVDGRAVDAGPGGALLGPTIVELADYEARLAREEIFGPVLAVVRMPDLASAVEWANRSRYGNSAILFTSSGGATREFRATIEAGMLGVNIGVAAPVAWFPFAGWKDSFDGDLHANGGDAFTFYTRAKVMTTRWS